MSSIKASKQLLRKDVMSKLNSLPYQDIIDQSIESLNVLQRLNIFQKSQNVGIFMSMDTEIQTQLIIKESFDLGKNVYLPHIANINKLDHNNIKLFKKEPMYLIFYQMDNYESVLNLEPIGKYKLKEPTKGQDLLDELTGNTPLDLLIMPGVAFTSKLDRLGHGGAFYDDFIKRHLIKFGSKPFLLGIGLDVQLVDSLPIEKHDEPLDGLIIKNQFYNNE
ncbi:5-formyltetrahydrofolate cyclo-ligase [Wickerhamomyces ciferrii]|uniref:5-formyltetrahydrofolate cyclo-ligase n=1 Tax=Wickerhamomyces ciferrii (strain ATCC 14091 / BCRC 22168 / CBS 111 / JCM 3599 / NBRC 0793 / NRRL Y-1031 F-60-10) TaxID=1206466 RepID=K0KK44_WICCF|nr:5-formyltetrahydrofolate cyclo-ligase [Wickerhamomyces ciferrii]CCH42547.1 5-formyltetrahydrofolate cyclo-ligase [Wickerhamomyces ciferrii]